MTKHNIYLITTAVVVLVFMGSGLANLLRVEHVIGDMKALGYPDYFPTIIGLFKVIGALGLLLPVVPATFKEWAYAGMLIDLSGAAISRAMAGHGAFMVLVPLCIAVVLLISRALRPDEGQVVHLRKIGS